jgi:hypothetical protein
MEASVFDYISLPRHFLGFPKGPTAHRQYLWVSSLYFKPLLLPLYLAMAFTWVLTYSLPFLAAL